MERAKVKGNTADEWTKREERLAANMGRIMMGSTVGIEAFGSPYLEC